MNKTTSSLLALAVTGLFLGGTTSCANQADKTMSASEMSLPKHACAGLNSCKDQGGCKSAGGCAGKNECSGNGGCATVAHHECGGKNECKGQGGCGASKGKNDCAGSGGCAVPIKH